MYAELVVFLRSDVQKDDLVVDTESSHSVIPDGIRPSIANYLTINVDEIKRDLDASCAMKVVLDTEGDVVARSFCIQLPDEMDGNEAATLAVGKWIAAVVSLYQEKQMATKFLKSLNAVQTNNLVEELFNDGASRSGLMYSTTHCRPTQILCVHKHKI